MSSSKRHLEYLILGYTRHVVPNISYPDIPLLVHTYTETQTHKDAHGHTRTETTLRCLARIRTRPSAPACYFSGSQSSPLRSLVPGQAAPRLPPPPSTSARCPPRNAESERAGHERVQSYELDAWIAGLREAGPGWQGVLGGRAHRIWTAAYSQVRRKVRPGSSQGGALLTSLV